MWTLWPRKYARCQNKCIFKIYTSTKASVFPLLVLKCVFQNTKLVEVESCSVSIMRLNELFYLLYFLCWAIDRSSSAASLRQSDRPTWGVFPEKERQKRERKWNVDRRNRKRKERVKEPTKTKEKERGQEIRKGIIYTRDRNRKAFKENGKRKKLVKKGNRKNGKRKARRKQRKRTGRNEKLLLRHPVAHSVLTYVRDTLDSCTYMHILHMYYTHTHTHTHTYIYIYIYI